LNFVVVLQESVTSLVGKFRECGPRQSAAASRCENSNQQAVSGNVGEILDQPNNKKMASFYAFAAVYLKSPLFWYGRRFGG